MQLASDATVLGDFNNARFVEQGRVTRFFRRGREFWVDTEGPDGSPAEFQVTHTFGVEPLQQYLVRYGTDRLQALPIAWDARAAIAGGQRWYHLYPEGEAKVGSPLHWTGALQRWNTMCADCHSTNLAKNYDESSHSFTTTWSEVSVGCEACHGPGSRHVSNPRLAGIGLRSVSRKWEFADASGIARRSPAVVSRDEIEQCASCHSHRTRIVPTDTVGQEFLEEYRPSLLEPDLYHPDGQIRGEVFEYGSFVQSLMYGAGVTCTDCHEPHTARLRYEGNALCTQCHLASKFDNPQHHHHKDAAGGPMCVDCHMRPEKYMGVDLRRDHSFRVPRPDLSVSLGTPEPCTGCHPKSDAVWAAKVVADWYPGGRHTRRHFGEALDAARRWSSDRSLQLQSVARDAANPTMARASAIALLGEQVDADAAEVIRTSLQDPEIPVQVAALRALEGIAPEQRASWVLNALRSSHRAVRIAAAYALAPIHERLDPADRAAFDDASAEYFAEQSFNSDRGGGLFNRGSMKLRLGRPQEARAAFEQALVEEPGFVSAAISLADLDRRMGDEQGALIRLRRLADSMPDNAGVRLALGLSLTRSGQPGPALREFDRAAALGGDEPTYAYYFGVALNSSGEPARAVAVLQRAHEKFPGHRDLLVALATMQRDRGDIAAALASARKLIRIVPSDPGAAALLRSLESAR